MLYKLLSTFQLKQFSNVWQSQNSHRSCLLDVSFCHQNLLINLSLRVNIKVNTQIISGVRNQIKIGKLVISLEKCVVLVICFRVYIKRFRTAKLFVDCYLWIVFLGIQSTYGVFFSTKKMCTLFQKMQFRVCFLKMFRPLKG